MFLREVLHCSNYRIPRFLESLTWELTGSLKHFLIIWMALGIHFFHWNSVWNGRLNSKANFYKKYRITENYSFYENYYVKKIKPLRVNVKWCFSF